MVPLLVFVLILLSLASGGLSVYCLFFHRSGRKVAVDLGRQYVIQKGEPEWFVGIMAGLFSPAMIFVAIGVCLRFAG